MKMIPVESTTLVAVAYDAPTQTMQLQFQGGAPYHYRGVPLNVYRALMNTSSRGKQFHQTIRGHFPFTAISSHDSQPIT